MEHTDFHADYVERFDDCITVNVSVVQMRAVLTHFWAQQKTNVETLPMYSPELSMKTQRKIKKNSME
jgi:hypothetical protein